MLDIGHRPARLGDKGRKITPEWRKRRAAKRTRRFVIADWGRVGARAAHDKVGPSDAIALGPLSAPPNSSELQPEAAGSSLFAMTWTQPVCLTATSTKSSLGSKTLGLIDVQRRPGKRPLVRLVKP